MDLKRNITNECFRIEKDCQYSAKGHFYAAQFWQIFYLIIGVVSIFLSTVAAAKLFNNGNGSENFFIGIISITTAALNAILTFINPSKIHSQHLNAGNAYKSLENNTRIFREIENFKLDDVKATIKLKRLNDKRNLLNTESIQIPKWAFILAKRGIQQGEAAYGGDIII